MYGAIFGDILGSPYEFEEIKYDDPATIELFHEDCHITDDSVLSFAVADWLLHDTRDVYYDDEKTVSGVAFVKTLFRWLWSHFWSRKIMKVPFEMQFRMVAMWIRWVACQEQLLKLFIKGIYRKVLLISV